MFIEIDEVKKTFAEKGYECMSEHEMCKGWSWDAARMSIFTTTIFLRVLEPILHN